ncbi:MAG TPA: penicillin-insensitive murein endopeptidase [Bdellovibrionales bacterium]|nr:penicillin-insensitive murein endopeptidase [Bdellovibrionales bacterium]
MLLLISVSFLGACGRARERASKDPMTGYPAPEGYRENPESDPSYVPNREYEDFRDETPRTSPPSPNEVPPAELPIYEQDEPETEASTPGSQPVTDPPMPGPGYDPTKGVKPPDDPRSPARPPFSPLNLEQAVGLYWDGYLVNGHTFPSHGTGYFASRYFRRVQATTYDLQKVIEYAALKIHDRYNKSILVGSISQPGGGKFSGHASHQNGLDADVYFIRVNDQDTGNLVVNGRVSRNFDTIKNYEFIKALVSTNRIRKVFVNRAIKRALCSYSRLQGLDNDPLQRKIAIESGHINHVHVRITCPLASPKCREQLDFFKNTECPVL